MARIMHNGVNLLSANLSWRNLLSELNAKFNIHSIEITEDKSYPLIFEEILFSIRGKSIRENLKSLKVQIKEIIKGYVPNKYHREIFHLQNNNILTTNYDYAFEKVVIHDYKGPESPGEGKEYRYSRRRRNIINGKRIWHIHGELNNGYQGKGTSRYPEQSILIGNEHYADYLRELHQLLKPSDREKGLITVLGENPNIWPRFFFTHDIDIIGIRMDYTEIHLWWLINFRARLKRDGISIVNTIRFNYPSFKKKEIENKLSLLKALEITQNEISINKTNNTVNDYRRFYDKFLDTYETL